MTVAPADIEHAVVNLLRLHEAESALLFCATRENVRRLHSSLVERGFSAVALSGEHSQNERNQALQALRDGRARVLVATDVAARGIDLPNLSLVVHVELPRDAETLQHRSGRTGRAGRKGIAVLVVPYPRRKRVEMVMRGARIEVEWIKPPTPEDIRRSDHDRLLAALLEPAEIEEEDRDLARRLMEAKPPEEIAAALVRAHRARMPAPEEMVDSGSAGEVRRPEGPRPGFEDTIWFRMDIGRRHNADPRWLLPLLCRRGHITKSEIGAIRIAAGETMFEVPRAAAGRFMAAVRRTATDEDGEGGVRIEPVEGKPRDAARQNRRAGPPPQDALQGEAGAAGLTPAPSAFELRPEAAAEVQLEPEPAQHQQGDGEQGEKGDGRHDGLLLSARSGRGFAGSSSRRRTPRRSPSSRSSKRVRRSRPWRSSFLASGGLWPSPLQGGLAAARVGRMSPELRDGFNCDGDRLLSLRHSCLSRRGTKSLHEKRE